MREIVRVADRDTVIDVAGGLARCGPRRCCARSAWSSSSRSPTIPFFGRTGRLLAAAQRDQELKWELLAPAGATG